MGGACECHYTQDQAEKQAEDQTEEGETVAKEENEDSKKIETSDVFDSSIMEIV